MKKMKSKPDFTHKEVEWLYEHDMSISSFRPPSLGNSIPDIEEYIITIDAIGSRRKKNGHAARTSHLWKRLL